MNYEEKYKNALEWAKSIYPSTFGTDREDLEHFFPELKENYDERIRKDITILVNDWWDRVATNNMSSRDEMLDWLEKQGENKPILCKNDISHIDSLLKRLEGLCRNEFERTRYAISEDEEWLKSLRNKICKQEEPKFKVGDWVIDKQGIIHQIANVVENVTNHTYGYDIVGGGYFNDNTEGVRLWTLADAKDGDVLYSPCCKLLWLYEDKKTCYVGNNLNYHSDSIVINNPICIPSDARPATRDEQTTLFVKMKEAGYEWDAENKELINYNKKGGEK